MGMKVSKVNHIRSSVGVIQEGTIGGFLYEDPSKNNKENTLDQLKKLNRKSQPLYNIFNQVQAGQKPSEPIEKNFSDKEKYIECHNNYKIKLDNYNTRERVGKVIKGDKKTKTPGLNSVIGKCLFYKPENKPKMMHENKKAYDNLIDCSDNINFDIDEIDEIVAVSLRRSLKDYSDGIKILLSVIRNKRQLNKNDESKLYEALNAIRKDYNKLVVSKPAGNEKLTGSDIPLSSRIVRSIESQNMVVQPSESEFALSSTKSTFIDKSVNNGQKNTTHKECEKKALDEFLLQYAVLDKNKREDMLRKLRRLIDVYFATPDGYKAGDSVSIPSDVDASDFNVWAKHEEGKKKEGKYIILPEILHNADKNTVFDSVTEKDLKTKLTELINDRNRDCYRYAKAVSDSDDGGLFFENKNINIFWIHHIQDAVERILLNKKKSTKSNEALFKLDNSYLCEKIWKDAINHISIKYIAIGKMVYHFGMNDLTDSGKNINLGVVSDEIKNGISSFDYEIIKARETLQRELAVSIAFSANNLARATVKIDENSDPLLLEKKELKNVLLYKNEEETLRAILQFFGGKSKWNDFDFKEKFGEEYGTDLLIELKEHIYSLRNETFHFNTIKNDIANSCRIGEMFEKEAAECTLREKEKFKSNNLPMFYKTEDLKSCLYSLYSKLSNRQSQVPSFNSVISRNNFKAYLTDTLKYKTPAYSAEDMDKWYSACYYLFKEIYYNSFVSSESAKKYFFKALDFEIEKLQKDKYIYSNNNKYFKNNNVRTDEKTSAKINATLDFYNRFVGFKDKYSLGEICQFVLSEYNYQNSNIRKVRTGKDSIMDEPIYEHYKAILKNMMANAFARYIKDNEEFKFIGEPLQELRNNDDDFLSDYKNEKYNNLINEVKKSSELKKWYVMGRFLNGRSLNLLVGSLRSYIQYVESVERRAKQTGNRLIKNENANIERIKNVIKVIDVCVRLSDVYSNEFTDYFADVNDYAKYLSNYVSYGKLENIDSIGYSEKLKTFCLTGRKEPFEIYVNKGGEPILNRNVVMAKLYGPDNVLKNIVARVEESDLEKFYKQKNSILEIKKKVKYESEDELRKTLYYQKLKNKIELRTICEYGEIINELLGQLINWSFMRERDLLYFQLGFHYYGLKNSSDKPEEYKTIIDKNGTKIKIEGAILYQIAAMYIYGIKVYGYGNKGFSLIGGQTGLKIPAFCRYSEKITGDKDCLYDAGLEAFETTREHNDIIEVRNKIDHFKYYLGHAGSILDLYSEVFDRFFSYDMKYQKNVMNSLSNILKRHNVIVDYKLGTGTKSVNDKTKDRAQIIITKITSDKFKYKIKNDKEYQLEAKNKEFIETINKLLNYSKVNEKDE